MEKKDLALKLLGLPGSERELLKEHLESCNELAKSVIERDLSLIHISEPTRPY